MKDLIKIAFVLGAVSFLNSCGIFGKSSRGGRNAAPPPEDASTERFEPSECHEGLRASLVGTKIEVWEAGNGHPCNSGRIASMTTSDDGKIFAGGRISSIHDVSVNNIAMYDLKTGKWYPLGKGIFSSFDPNQSDYIYNNPVQSMAYAKGKLYVTGYFKKAGEVDVDGAAVWDFATSAWSALPLCSVGIGILVTDDEGAVYSDLGCKWVGGELKTFESQKSVYAVAIRGSSLFGHTADYLKTLDTKLLKWSDEIPAKLEWLGSGVREQIDKIAFGDNSEIYVSGTFESVNGVKAKNVAMWDGAKWNALGDGIKSSAPTMAYHSSGLYVRTRWDADHDNFSFRRWKDGRMDDLSVPGMLDTLDAVAVMLPIGNDIWMAGINGVIAKVPSDEFVVKTPKN